MVYTATWVITYHLQPNKDTRKLHWIHLPCSIPENHLCTTVYAPPFSFKKVAVWVTAATLLLATAAKDMNWLVKTPPQKSGTSSLHPPWNKLLASLHHKKRAGPLADVCRWLCLVFLEFVKGEGENDDLFAKIEKWGWFFENRHTPEGEFGKTWVFCEWPFVWHEDIVLRGRGPICGTLGNEAANPPSKLT